jgi:hypothetical protein
MQKNQNLPKENRFQSDIDIINSLFANTYQKYEMGRRKSGTATKAVSDEVDGDFLKLFNGKEGIAGKQQGYDDAVDWLEEGHAKRKIFTCIVFYEKPVEFLATGKTKSSGKGDGKKVEDKLAEYLPMHEGPLQKEVAERDPKRYGVFTKVNFTMVRRVALLSLQKGWAEDDTRHQWEVAYGGRPTAINFDNAKWHSMQKETREIKQEGIKAFQDEREYWVDMELSLSK